MEYKFISSTLNWLKSTEMFARPSKQIPGKWELVEYYIETGNELLHFPEDKIREGKEFWNIEFKEDEHYSHKCSLPVSFISKMKDGKWSISKNYITFISPEDFRDCVEFQFAIDKGMLKFLKKDGFGKIEFFGFFNRQL